MSFESTLRPLEKACIDIIVQDFERFYFTFSISNEEILIQNIKFLQRFYSFELILNFLEKNLLVDKYLDFLLNEHLKYFDGDWLYNTSYENSIKDIFCRLPNLTKISVSLKCNDEILENIAAFCPNVTEIEASTSAVTDTGLKYFCKNEEGELPCPYLKSFIIYDTHVTDEGVKYLMKNLPNLEDTQYENVPGILYYLHEKDLTNPENLPVYNTVYLYLSEYSELPYYTDLLKLCFTVCPRLKNLELHITDEKQLDLLEGLKLEKLNLDALSSKPKIDINNFLEKKGCYLVSLNVFHCIISVNVLIANCPNLQVLEIFDCAFIEDPVNSQYVLHYLRNFIIKRNRDDHAFQKSLILLLSSSPNLVYLEFYDCHLSVEAKIHILKCCENNLLNYITFSHTRVEMRFLKDILLSCVSLMDLRMYDCDAYSPEEVRELEEFVKMIPKKPSVYVHGYGISVHYMINK